MILISLLVTLITGLLFLVGVLIVKYTTHKKNITEFSTSLAFSVIISLLFLDIIPEIIEQWHYMNIYKLIVFIFGFILIGIIILMMLDKLIPAHNHNHHDDETNHNEHNNHMYHLGMISSIALVLHNVIEGLSIYTVCLASIKSGIFLGLGVALHNIPMGMEIATFLDNSKKSKKKKILTYIFICMSTFAGALIALAFGEISPMVLGIVLSITSGMLIYIVIFELSKEVRNNIKSKYTIAGIIVGCMIMGLTLVL